MMTTDSGRSDSTLAATSPAMPATVDGASGRLLRSFSTTDALPCACSPVKRESLAGAICTRALDTSAIVEMVRPSSPSSPRRKLTCSRNSVVPNAVRSNTSKPMRPVVGRLHVLALAALVGGCSSTEQCFGSYSILASAWPEADGLFEPAGTDT